jgi:hypothetical protein
MWGGVRGFIKALGFYCKELFCPWEEAGVFAIDPYGRQSADV